MPSQDALVLVITSGSMLASLGLLCFAGLNAWRGWLALRRFEIEQAPAPDHSSAAPLPAAVRIEVADLRERVRKLEAIAAGVDL